jgi:TM2 domain-containing membrane protein YozV
MQLSTQQQMLVEQRLANEKKSLTVAYLLWFFLAAFSAHRFYLGTTAGAVIQLGLFWGGLLLLIVYVGALLLLVWGIWIIADAFLIPGLVDKDAQSKKSRIINEVALTTRPE